MVALASIPAKVPIDTTLRLVMKQTGVAVANPVLSTTTSLKSAYYMFTWHWNTAVSYFISTLTHYVSHANSTCHISLRKSLRELSFITSLGTWTFFTIMGNKRDKINLFSHFWIVDFVSIANNVTGVELGYSLCIYSSTLLYWIVKSTSVHYIFYSL